MKVEPQSHFFSNLIRFVGFCAFNDLQWNRLWSLKLFRLSKCSLHFGHSYRSWACWLIIELRSSSSSANIAEQLSIWWRFKLEFDRNVWPHLLHGIFGAFSILTRSAAVLWIFLQLLCWWRFKFHLFLNIWPQSSHAMSFLVNSSSLMFDWIELFENGFVIFFSTFRLSGTTFTIEIDRFGLHSLMRWSNKSNSVTNIVEQSGHRFLCLIDRLQLHCFWPQMSQPKIKSDKSLISPNGSKEEKTKNNIHSLDFGLRMIFRQTCLDLMILLNIHKCEKKFRLKEMSIKLRFLRLNLSVMNLVTSVGQ